jgi:hypothetical protein
LTGHLGAEKVRQLRDFAAMRSGGGLFVPEVEAIARFKSFGETKINVATLGRNRDSIVLVVPNEVALAGLGSHGISRAHSALFARSCRIMMLARSGILLRSVGAACTHAGYGSD